MQEDMTMGPSLPTRLLDAAVLTLILAVPGSLLAYGVAWASALPVLPAVATTIGTLLVASLLSAAGGYLASILDSRLRR